MPTQTKVVNEDRPKKPRRYLTLKIVTSILLVLAFAASVVVSVFIGGELLEKDTVEKETNGIIQLAEPNYQQTYFVGDSFSFDKDENQVTLVARDPAIENVVRIDDLPGPEYGFYTRTYYNQEGERIDLADIEDNALIYEDGYEYEVGESEDGSVDTTPIYTYKQSEFYTDASDISMTLDVGTIFLASKRYQNLNIQLDTTVIDALLDEEKLQSALLLEAEEADIYMDDVLLSESDLETLPSTSAPFISSKGTSVAGTDCSGGACLRNFGTYNMKIDFVVVASKQTNVDLVLKLCKRPDARTFSSAYKFNLNGVTYEEVDNQQIPSGSSGQYYEAWESDRIEVKLNKGINHFIFESGSSVGTSSPNNFDAIELFTTDESTSIGGDDCIIYNNESEAI